MAVNGEGAAIANNGAADNIDGAVVAQHAQNNEDVGAVRETCTHLPSFPFLFCLKTPFYLAKPQQWASAFRIFSHLSSKGGGSALVCQHKARGHAASSRQHTRN